MSLTAVDHSLAESAGEPRAASFDLGAATNEIETYDSRSGEVIVVRHERGWRLVGRSKHQQSPCPDEDYGQFEAEICDCTRCPTNPRPICDIWHRTTPPSRHTAGRGSSCHEPGHIERVRALAKAVAKTYR